MKSRSQNGFLFAFSYYWCEYILSASYILASVFIAGSKVDPRPDPQSFHIALLYCYCFILRSNISTLKNGQHCVCAFFWLCTIFSSCTSIMLLMLLSANLSHSSSGWFYFTNVSQRPFSGACAPSPPREYGFMWTAACCLDCGLCLCTIWKALDDTFVPGSRSGHWVLFRNTKENAEGNIYISSDIKGCNNAACVNKTML